MEKFFHCTVFAGNELNIVDQEQVRAAEAEKEALAAQVQAKQQENDALAADIAQGSTQEKMEEMAREELGLVYPGERVFYDTSN